MTRGADTTPDVLVCGGGVAGLACAVRLARAGARVTLLESRRKLGGRATSHTDGRSGETIDNCQHVALGCCVNYIDLLDLLGAGDALRFDETQTWIEPGGRRTTLRPGPLPAPAHYARAFAGARFLSAGEKAGVAGFMARALWMDRAAYADDTFARVLADAGVPDGAVRKFFEPVIVSACNLSVQRVAADAALHVFQEALLESRRGGVIGVPRVPLVRLYDGAAKLLARAGGSIVLGASVERYDAGSVTLASGQTLHAGAVVCALPFERASAAADEGVRARDPRFAMIDALGALGHSPILGVHLRFDRPVLDVPHAVLVDRPTQWLFVREDPADDRPRGAALHAVISAADEWMTLSEEQIVARVMDDVRACLPEVFGAGDAPRLLHARAVKEKRATFVCSPEARRCRPATLRDPDRAGRTGEALGVVLAGDYVQTGWPATMESATRAGYMAAAGVLGLAPEALLVPPLRPEGLSRAALALRRWGGVARAADDDAG